MSFQMYRNTRIEKFKICDLNRDFSYILQNLIYIIFFAFLGSFFEFFLGSDSPQLEGKVEPKSKKEKHITLCDLGTSCSHVFFVNIYVYFLISIIKTLS